MVLLKKQWRIIALAAALMATAAVAVFITIMMAGCADKPNNPATPDNGGNTDTYDGGNDGVVGIIDKNSVVTIGGMKWMKQNLNIRTADSWCYGNSDDSCAKYGRLYTWAAAKTACPSGWHLPTRNEWTTLAKAAGAWDDFGSNATAGTKLKSKSGWYNKGNGTDGLGFSALPGGHRNSDAKGGTFESVGAYGKWWTATEQGVGRNVYYREMSYNSEVVDDKISINEYGYSVRCVVDEIIGGGSYYDFVTVEGKKWMAKNLNIETADSWCYNNGPGNCEKYGRLYTWNAAKTACPKGWRLPSDMEWDALANAGAPCLKSTCGWYGENEDGGWGNGSDGSGFSALPGGYRDSEGGFNNGFAHVGSKGYWWTALGRSDGKAYYISLSAFWGTAERDFTDKRDGLSVRCVAEK